MIIDIVYIIFTLYCFERNMNNKFKYDSKTEKSEIIAHVVINHGKDEKSDQFMYFYIF